MASDPMQWSALAVAAWPLWFALGVLVIVGTAGHWTHLLDRLESSPRMVLWWLRIRYGIRPRHTANGWELRSRRHLRTVDTVRATDLFVRRVLVSEGVK